LWNQNSKQLVEMREN